VPLDHLAAVVGEPAGSGRRPRGTSVAVALHTAWDASSGIAARAVVAVISLGLLARVVHRTGSRTASADGGAVSAFRRWP
jgi:hypothetical protein